MNAATLRTIAPAALCLILASSVAAGQPTEAQSSEGRQRFQEGLALHDAHDEENAYVKFTQAYALFKAPAVIFNLARTEQLTGRSRDAAAHYREYLALPDQPKVTADTRKQAREFLAEARAKLGHVTVTAPAGAALLVDGESAGSLPLPDALDLSPGPHRLEVRLGDRSKVTTVSVASGETQTITVDLSEPPPAASSSGTDTGTLPPPPLPPEPGDHGSSSARTWLTIGLGAGVLATAITGIGLEVAAGSSSSQANQLRSQLLTQGSSPCSGAAPPSACQQLQNDNQSAHNQHAQAAGFFVAGGVLAAAAVVVLVWPSHHGGTAALTVSPAPGGLRIAGSF